MTVKLTEKIKEGDVLYTSCADYQLCYHVGIVYDDGKKKLVYHNEPSNNNRYGGTICAERYEDFINKRNVVRVVSTNAKNADILNIARTCKSERWDSIFFNCEDFVMQILEGHRRSDIRDAYKIAVLGFVIIILL